MINAIFAHFTFRNQMKKRHKARKEQTMSNLIHKLIPHQNTALTFSDEGVIVKSKPISTPGSYALLEVRPESTITIFIRASVSFPSTAFLYAADSTSGNELIKRNIIFDSDEHNDGETPSELYSSIEIPSNVSEIRIGLPFLYSFSTRTTLNDNTSH